MAKTKKKERSFSNTFNSFCNSAAKVAGKPWVFAVAALSIVVWLLLGPFLDFSDTWQLIINTSTTIITFLMVFLIQNSQNSNTNALQIKLDELLIKNRAPRDFVKLEELSEEEINRYIKHFEELKRKKTR